MSGYYARNASKLFEQYQSLDPAALHDCWRNRLPEPGLACDIGAGSGRDANWLAVQGWDVVAVEPCAELRQLANATSHPNVTWLDDKLPELAKLRAVGHRFQLILLSAVWMHLPPTQRSRAFRIITELLAPGGLLVISLRHGSNEAENAERGFFEINAEELLQLAKGRAIALLDQCKDSDQRGRSDVHWETLVFQLPDDGTGSLPLLRHIIVNDAKAGTHKLGLLRALIRIAEGAPGMVLRRTDDFVEIPFGLVGLYWLKLYLPLVLRHHLVQSPSHDAGRRTGLGFAGDAFYKLEKLSLFDLRIGSSFAAEQAKVIIEAIRDACANIKQMPATFIKYPGQNRPVFDCDRGSKRARLKSDGHWQINKETLADFGTFRIPTNLWQTCGQYACWLEPAIVNEWANTMMAYQLRYDRSVCDTALQWDENRRDTTRVRGRVHDLQVAGETINCVWTSRKLNDRYDIDHCFPWSRWSNNDLWNLMPASAQANSQKKEKLPSSGLMHSARDRILHWWEVGYTSTEWFGQFFMEAEAALPLVEEGERDLDVVFEAMLHQRAKLKANQQLVEWTVNRELR